MKQLTVFTRDLLVGFLEDYFHPNEMSERDDRMVLHDDAAHFQPLGVAALGRNLRDAHVYRIVFLDVHLASLQQWSVDLACFIPTFFRGFRRQRPPVENDSIGAMDGESDFRLPKRRRTRSRRNAVEHSTFSPDELRQVPTC